MPQASASQAATGAGTNRGPGRAPSATRSSRRPGARGRHGHGSARRRAALASSHPAWMRSRRCSTSMQVSWSTAGDISAAIGGVASTWTWSCAVAACSTRHAAPSRELAAGSEPRPRESGSDSSMRSSLANVAWTSPAAPPPERPVHAFTLRWVGARHGAPTPKQETAMKPSSRLCAPAVLAMALAVPAFAQDARPASAPAPTADQQQAAAKALTAGEVRELLTRAGYTKVDDLELDKGMWEADATSANGKRVDVRVGADGRIFADDQVSSLNADDVKARLTAAGYSKIHDVEFDGGIWKAEGERADGQKVEFRVDPKDGRILGVENDCPATCAPRKP